MTYVIAGSCIKDDSCIEVCPVDCIHPKPGAPDFETAEQLYIDPEVCIDCDACVEACPVDAIFPDFELPEKYDYALDAERRVLRRGEHDRAHRRLMAARESRSSAPGPAGAFAAASPAARARRRGDRPVRAAADAVGAAARRRRARPPGDQAPGGHVRPPDARARLPLPRQRRGRRRRLARRADAPLHGGDLRDRRADRQVARHPRRGPARELGGDRVRRLVQRPPRLPRPRVRPLGAARRRDRQRQRRGRRRRAC